MKWNFDFGGQRAFGCGRGLLATAKDCLAADRGLIEAVREFLATDRGLIEAVRGFWLRPEGFGSGQRALAAAFGSCLEGQYN